MVELVGYRELENMGQQEKLEELFQNNMQLSRYGLRKATKDVQRYGGVWIDATRDALVSPRTLEALDSALQGLDEAKELVDAIKAEIDAVLALQRDALRHVEVDPSSAATEEARPHGWRRRFFGKVKRAGNAGHSLSGSFREALGDLLPGWAKGILKVGEEVWEIYGK
ncbi:hypothetical protein [Lysobacter capsici]|uniref:hypothetical protein n=1 Tax=Lysobacter capsici TaxID=435897 RepID=UPI0012FD1B7B|nr:hypothetical protein [Lysobacter capsici]